MGWLTDCTENVACVDESGQDARDIDSCAVGGCVPGRELGWKRSPTRLLR